GLLSIVSYELHPRNAAPSSPQPAPASPWRCNVTKDTEGRVSVLGGLSFLAVRSFTSILPSEHLQRQAHDDHGDRRREHPWVRREHDVLLQRHEHAAPRGRRLSDADAEERERDFRDDERGHTH